MIRLQFERRPEIALETNPIIGQQVSFDYEVLVGTIVYNFLVGQHNIEAFAGESVSYVFFLHHYNN